MIESARAADAARLAADMESERAKLSELQANHLVFSRELAAARSQEVSQKRDLMNFQDELDSIKKKHAREIADLEADLRKRDRKLQDLEEDLRLSAQDLSRERSNSSILKATISEQSTTHVALKAQVNALQAQLTAVQASSDSNSFTASEYRLKWEDAERKVQQLEDDLQDAEMSRRRLHNMVQELKGNIRVFCRVRPVLPSELTPAQGEAVKDASEVTARIEYPDRLDHKEIVLNSTSESATGQERKETWQFTFDRVCVSFILALISLMDCSRSSNLIRLNQKFSKISRNSPRAVSTDTMSVFSRMARLVPANLSLWKVGFRS
jgi:kinesin family protein C1